MSLLLIPLALSCWEAADASEISVCNLSYRPKTNETAFAAVGSSLKIADETCTNHYLIIPFDTVSNAITIPQGEYRALQHDEEEVLFSTDNGAGQKVKSCPVCDPIDYLVIRKKTPKTLCVKSALKVNSCAVDDAISYVVTKKSHTTEGLCAPSLVYFGRDGNTLKFAVNDCTSISKPTLSYDLSLGDEIRFLDEQIKIIKADNKGIFYSRMEPPVLKVNDLLTKEQLEQELSQKQNNKTASTDDKIVPTQNETGAPQNEDAPPQSSELQNTVQ
ncbi:hypothetical protein [Succinivibrio dextrinosolvens]|uniref:hypothetical protein n=1 Tax=Succinivibrio dextrinosolvens TaxID=83771 RepID=UPI0019241716|nr:hypothetical protein [Succinivibrio dextrinosolvens]